MKIIVIICFSTILFFIIGQTSIIGTVIYQQGQRLVYAKYSQPELSVRTYGANDWSERTLLLTYSFSFGNQSLKAKRVRTTGSQEERNRM